MEIPSCILQTAMPYASVIIPVHKRYSTLSFALESIQQQSIRDLEIILAGDGCTEPVRKTCQSFAGSDARIRFLDLPKAPLRGVMNRDLAVRSARSERIFYCDDDDFFLPDHIRILGDELKSCDLIDTPPASLCPEGHVVLGLHNSGHPTQKKMLREERFKGVFDTHLAHRKEVYMSNASAWLNAHDHRVVLHMLKTFANNPSITWKTINRITALSLHGARRCCMSSEDRRSEMKYWSSNITSTLEETVRRNGQYSWHFLRMLWALAGETEADQKSFLSSLGIQSQDHSGKDFTYSINIDIQIPKRQEKLLMAALALAQGQRYELRSLSLLLDELLDPLLGPQFPSADLIRRLRFLYSNDEIKLALSNTRMRPARHLAEFQLKLQSGAYQDKDIRFIQEKTSEVPSYDRFFFGLGILEALSHQRLYHQAWNWSNEILDWRPESKFELEFWKIRRNLAEILQYQGELQEAMDKIQWCSVNPD
jgi:glycosyltransferase involved in cell wall biosynthesis